jgi:hypothetical protein
MATTVCNFAGVLPAIIVYPESVVLGPRISSAGTPVTEVTRVPVGVPVFGAQTLASGAIGTAYSETLSAQGGTSPYTFVVFYGPLPAGLSLDSATGVISGTPTTAEISRVVVQAMDANGNTGTLEFSITIWAVSVQPACVFVG